MEGYHVVKTWSVFESHSRKTLSGSETFVKKAAFRLNETKLRAVAIRQRGSQRNERYHVAATVGL